MRPNAANLSWPSPQAIDASSVETRLASSEEGSFFGSSFGSAFPSGFAPSFGFSFLTGPSVSSPPRNSSTAFWICSGVAVT